MALKHVWITEHTRDLVSLSMESEIVDPEYMRIKVSEQVFPEKPTKKSPKRHTVCLKLFTEADLCYLRDVIDDYLLEGKTNR